MTSTRCAFEGLCREVNEKMPFAGVAVLASPKERSKVRFVWKWDISIIPNKKDMKKFSLIFGLFLVVATLWAARTRVIVTSDIGGSDPDDQQSLVHLLTLLDRVELEGVIYQYAWVSFNRADQVKAVSGVLDAYESVWPNLRVHSDGFPEPSAVRQMVCHGQSEAAMAGVGEGKDSPGSELIIRAVDRDDERPVWIAAWSGMNTLAQALWKVKHTRSEAQVRKFVQKLRVYDILGQDEAGAWMVKEFPELVYIRNKEVYGWPSSDDWHKEHVQSVGDLGAQYPDRRWATEGDSPSFLYVIDNGLNSPEHPDWGGWGGRFDMKRKTGIRSMDWVPRSNLDETQYDPSLMIGSAKEGVEAIRMWSDDISRDFAARMKWTVASSYEEANHHPVAVLDKDKTTDALFKSVKAGSILKLDASRSSDPDGDALSYEWIFYKEPSSYKGTLSIAPTSDKQEISIPVEAKGKTIHLILRVTDNGSPALTSYRRVVLNCR